MNRCYCFFLLFAVGVGAAIDCSDLENALVWTVGPNGASGWVHPAFENTFLAYDSLFSSSAPAALVDDGSQFAVSVDGLCTVLHASGYANGTAPVSNQTLFHGFSTSKGLLPLAAAFATFLNLTEWHDKVADRWPAFGNFGKTDISFQKVTTHSDGMIHLNPYTVDKCRNNLYMDGVVSSTSPLRFLYGDPAYHPFSIGSIFDAVLRHIDVGSNRNVPEFLTDEFLSKFPNGTFEFYWTYDAGIPAGIASRKAQLGPLINLFILDAFIPFLCNSSTLPVEYCLANTGQATHSIFDFENVTFLADFYNPAALLFTNAISLARLYGVVTTRRYLNQYDIIDPSAIRKAAAVVFEGLDKTSPFVPIVMTRGGWARDLSFAGNDTEDPSSIIYRDGLGGQFAGGHLTYNAGWSYLTRYMQILENEKVRYNFLAQQLLSDLAEFRSE